MLKQFLILTLLLFSTFAIKQRKDHLQGENHELFEFFSEPYNPKNRTEK